MKPKLTVIDSIEGLNELHAYLQDKDFIAYDCETTGLTRDSSVIGFSVCAEEAQAFYVILAKWRPEASALEVLPYLEMAKTVITSLQNKFLLMHNAIFDCSMAESFFTVNLSDSLHTDTMILAHLLDENRRVGLKELGITLFGENVSIEQKEMQDSVLKNGGKLTKKQYEMYKCDPYIMGKYGAKDAWLTYRLFFELVPTLYEQGLDKFFYEEESMPLLKGPTYQMNTVGLKVDMESLKVLKKTLEAECAEAKAFIFNEISSHIKDKYPGTTKTNVFNIGSGKQLTWLLFSKLDLEFGTLTDTGRMVCRALGISKLPYSRAEKRQFIVECNNRIGEVYDIKTNKTVKPSWEYIKCDKSTLTKLAPKYRWIQTLLDYKKKMKLLSTYIKGIEERIQY
jgi:DNA polymerase-1